MRGVAAGVAAAAVLALVAAPRAGAVQDPPAGLRPPGTTLRVAVLPIEVKGKRPPGPAQLRRMVREASDWLARASNGRLRLEGVVAPPFVGGALTRRLRSEDRRAFELVQQRAAERGVAVDGAVPIYVAPALRTFQAPEEAYRSGGKPSLGVIMRTTQWRVTEYVVHELLHARGLDHANTPACPRRAHTCRRGSFWRTTEYGDRFDIMGTGRDAFGAYGLVALGLAPITDAPPGSGVTAVLPPGGRDPTLLRLRTAGRDWYVESRTRLRAWPDPVRYRLPPSVIVSYARPRYRVGNDPLMPPSYRVANRIDRGCRRPPCVDRFLYRRGARLSVPGVFRLRVLGGRPARVRTTWLDRTPPALTVVSSAVRRAPGGAAEVAVRLRSRVQGAGLLAAEIDQGGAISRVPADFVPGLVTRGRGEVRVPLAAGAAGAAIRLVDAAGNASPWAPLDLSRSLPAARVDFDPPLGWDDATGTRLSGTRTVTIRGATDPALAGFSVDFSVTGESELRTLPIGADGTFSTTWSPAARGSYRLILKVPVERIPGSIDLRYEIHDGYARW